MNNHLIEVKGLRKVFPHPRGAVEALKNINFQLESGESVAVVGVSGAGKSTLLHILGAIDHASEGEVVFDGVKLSQLDPLGLAQLRNNKIGFVFQFHHLLPEFDALENVMMPALIARVSQSEARKRAQAILEELGLGERKHHRVGELSGGEAQRVAVARAVILEPKLLLCDEPTGNLDAEIGKKVEDLLVELNQKKGISLVVATHNENLAQRMKRQIRLFNGEIVSNSKNR